METTLLSREVGRGTGTAKLVTGRDSAFQSQDYGVSTSAQEMRNP